MHPTSYVRSVLVSAVLLGIAVPSHSIGAQPSALTGDSTARRSVLTSTRNTAVSRVYNSAVGAGVGGALGALLGSRVSHDYRASDGDVSNVTPYAALVGFAIGAAIGTASETRSECQFTKRFIRSFVGAAAAASVAFVVSDAAHDTGSLIAAVPIGAVGGSIAALGGCRKSI